MFRKSENLVKKFEKVVKELERYMEPGMPQQRDNLTSNELKKIQKLLNSLIEEQALLNKLVEDGINDVGNRLGMTFNEDTQKRENIFASHHTAKVVRRADGIGVGTDGSEYYPSDTFGKVISKGFSSTH